MTYKLKVAGVERDLTLCPISERLMIAGFVMLGDTELTEACAEGLCRLLPEHDVLITAEAKGIPLICAMARQLGEDRYSCTLTPSPAWVDSLHAFDIGANVYASAKYKDAAKIMFGAEYTTARKNGQDCYNGWEFTTALRSNF